MENGFDTIWRKVYISFLRIMCTLTSSNNLHCRKIWFIVPLRLATFIHVRIADIDSNQGRHDWPLVSLFMETIDFLRSLFLERWVSIILEVLPALLVSRFFAPLLGCYAHPGFQLTFQICGRKDVMNILTFLNTPLCQHIFYLIEDITPVCWDSYKCNILFFFHQYQNYYEVFLG
jgi:hypothetical protein